MSRTTFVTVTLKESSKWWRNKLAVPKTGGGERLATDRPPSLDLNWI